MRQWKWAAELEGLGTEREGIMDLKGQSVRRIFYMDIKIFKNKDTVSASQELKSCRSEGKGMRHL